MPLCEPYMCLYVYMYTDICIYEQMLNLGKLDKTHQTDNGQTDFMADGKTFPCSSESVFVCQSINKHPIYFQGENEERRVERKLANMKKRSEADQKRIKVWGKLQTFCPIKRSRHTCPRPLSLLDRRLCCCRFWKRYGLG